MISFFHLLCIIASLLFVDLTPIVLVDSFFISLHFFDLINVLIYD